MATTPPGSAAPAVGPCPRCSAALAPEGGGTSFHCNACTGTFIRREVLERFLESFKSVGATGGYRTAARTVVDEPNSLRGRGAWEPEVRYLMCPLCIRPMMRQNFARKSGILVDHCAPHGTWFDAGEARAVAEWVAQGGQLKPEAEQDKPAISRTKVDIIALLRR